jgi:hypothetical protein
VPGSSTKRWYLRIKFGYNAKMGVYANSSSDIPKIGDIELQSGEIL